jgi:hypothetical protein
MKKSDVEEIGRQRNGPRSLVVERPFPDFAFKSELGAPKGTKIVPECHTHLQDKSALYVADEYPNALALESTPSWGNRPACATEIECHSIVSSSYAVVAAVSRSDPECCRCHSALVLVPDLLFPALLGATQGLV